MNRRAGLTFLAALLALPATAVASVGLHLPVPAPMAAKIFGLSLAEPHRHAFAPRPEAVASVSTLSVRSSAFEEGFVHFGQARFGSRRHTPITLALFGMPQHPAALEPLAASTSAPETALAETVATPSPLETPDFAGSVVAGITFRVTIPTAQPPAVGAPSLATPAVLSALRTVPARFAAAPAIGPAFANAQSVPATFGNPAPSDAVAPPPSGYGSSFYNALVPNSSGLAFQVSAPVHIGNASLRANFDAAHLQETTPNAFGTMPSQPALTDRIGAGTSFDVRAFGRRVSLDLGTAYEHLTRSDTSALTYTPYAPPAVTVPVPAAALPGVNVPVYVTPNYVDVTRRTLNASAAVPLSRSLSLNVQYNTQYYTGSYSGINQNIDERKDSYLGNLTYRIPRSSSAIVFSAKQYRYRDAFVPTYNVTQNRADLNFTVKF